MSEIHQFEQVAKSVLVVEDHPLVAEAMRIALGRPSLSLRLTVASTADEAIAALTGQTQWFRVFLDLDIPGARGLSLAREVSRLGIQSTCCIVTASDKAELIQETQAHGFLGYIVKACPYDQFEQALTDILAGKVSFPSKTSFAPAIRLTRRQVQLLQLVGEGHSSKEIARLLFLSEGTVSNGITAAMRALGAGTRAHAVAMASELGLLSPASADAGVKQRF
jgi:DNA-binding NarL/FixJ family response regulator